MSNNRWSVPKSGVFSYSIHLYRCIKYVIIAVWRATNDCHADCGSSISFHPLNQNSLPLVGQRLILAHWFYLVCPSLSRTCADEPVTNAAHKIFFFEIYLHKWNQWFIEQYDTFILKYFYQLDSIYIALQLYYGQKCVSFNVTCWLLKPCVSFEKLFFGVENRSSLYTVVFITLHCE